MRRGFYGKFPAKRDFVATGASREFLTVFEPWLQASVSASRQQLGTAWQQAYLQAPIWRFWLGQDVAGAATLGAIMPSVDGVGRYFPLTVYARSEAGESIPPPDLDSNDPWLGAVEDLLLSALAEGASIDLMTAALEAVEGPGVRRAADPLPDGSLRLRDGSLATEGDPSSLAALRAADPARSYGSATCWWTVGGEGFAPRTLMARAMPDPYLFAGMITGRFDEGAS